MKVRDRFDKNRIGELVCDGAFKYVQNFAVEINGKRVAEYGSLDGVAEEWEDYTPAEPLIKDEKIRKAVRAWAGANGSENEAFYICTPFYRMLRISARSRCIEFSNDGSFGQIDFTKGYTIAELCGEEEE